MIEKKEKFNLQDPLSINGRITTRIETKLGYLQILEYFLQDCSYLHIVQWHFNNDLQKDSFLPNMHCVSFYNEENEALELAHEIGNKLLKQYDIP